MKRLLLVFIVSLCVLGWRAPVYLEELGLVKPDEATLQARAEEMARKMALEAAANPQIKPMSAHEFAALAHSDPEAYKRYVNSYVVRDRGEVDKLMNFFKNGEYK